MPSRTTKVLVVGAGPVGLTLASELFRHGVPCRLIDSAPQATIKTKALGIMPRTLELLAKQSLTEEVFKRGLSVTAFNPFSNGKRIARIEFQEYLADIPYPCVLMLPQHETEAVLTANLLEQGGIIEWATELTQLSQQDGYVETTLRHGNGQEEQVRVEWLVGCDGAHSTVRHLLKLDFEGDTLEQSFAVGNVSMHWDLTPDEIYVFVRKGSFIAFFPMLDGCYRVIVAYDMKEAPSGDVTLEEIQQMIDISGLPAGARADTPTELVRFRVNQRKAVRYAQRRVFLAGDAVHIHSPVGAQGMNTGMQDAFNLAWKLALAVKEQASPKLLDSYEMERGQVGTALLKGTNLATHVALTRNPLLAILRTYVAPLILSNRAIRRRMVRIITEISLDYRQSEWIIDQRSKKGALEAGDRAPNGRIRLMGDAEPGFLFETLAVTRSVVLVFAGKHPGSALKRQWQEIEELLASGYGQRLEAYLITQQDAPKGVPSNRVLHDFAGELHRRYDIPRGGLLLVRPDGYIGFWGHFRATEALRTYTKKIFT